MSKFSHVLDDTCGGEEIMGGYAKRIAIIPICAIKTYPTREKTPANLEDICNYSGTFELDDTKQSPIVVDIISGSLQYKSDPQGEVGSKSFKPTATFRVKDKRKADGLAKYVMNTPCIVIANEHNDGGQFFIGNKDLPCDIAAAFDSGAKAADARGYTFTIDVDGSFVPKQYLSAPIDIDALTEAKEETES